MATVQDVRWCPCQPWALPAFGTIASADSKTAVSVICTKTKLSLVPASLHHSLQAGFTSCVYLIRNVNIICLIVAAAKTVPKQTPAISYFAVHQE